MEKWLGKMRRRRREWWRRGKHDYMRLRRNIRQHIYIYIYIYT
jgi:hypothetical protein